jgi:hypothetical protein
MVVCNGRDTLWRKVVINMVECGVVGVLTKLGVVLE